MNQDFSLPRQDSEDHYDMKILEPSEQFNKGFTPDDSIPQIEFKQTEQSFIGVHPRYTPSELRTQLEDKYVSPRQKQAKLAPFEHYECLLYELNARWNNLGCKLGATSIQLHYVFRLKQVEQALTLEDLGILNDELEFYLSTHPTLYTEYSLFSDCLGLISALAVRYKVLKMHELAYRLTDRALNIQLLDLKELNADFYKVESLWLATKIHDQPFEALTSEHAKQAAFILVEIMEELLGFLSSLNAECPFDTVPCIRGLVAAKSLRFRLFTGNLPDHSAEVVAYQRLKTRRGARLIR